jgi:Tfp pilus assembly protein PilO
MKFTTRDRVLLGVIVVVLLCGGFYKFALTPVRHKAAHLQSQITTAQTTLAKAQQQDLAGHSAEVALRRLQPDWSAAQRAVPKVANVPALLKVLTRTAQSAHVTMQSISLSAATTSAATATAPATGTASTGSGVTVTTIPVALTFTGGYQALNRLVSHLDSYVTVSHKHLHVQGPLVGIGNVSVTPSESSTHPGQLTVQLTASIYQRSGNTEGS